MLGLTDEAKRDIMNWVSEPTLYKKGDKVRVMPTSSGIGEQAEVLEDQVPGSRRVRVQVFRRIYDHLSMLSEMWVEAGRLELIIEVGPACALTNEWSAARESIPLDEVTNACEERDIDPPAPGASLDAHRRAMNILREEASKYTIKEGQPLLDWAGVMKVMMTGPPIPDLGPFPLLKKGDLTQMKPGMVIYYGEVGGPVQTLEEGDEVELVEDQVWGIPSVKVVKVSGGPSVEVATKYVNVSAVADTPGQGGPHPCHCPPENFAWNGLGCQCGGV